MIGVFLSIFARLQSDGHRVLVVVDDNISLIVYDQQGILDQQLKPYQY
jgi:hypothetical protein